MFFLLKKKKKTKNASSIWAPHRPHAASNKTNERIVLLNLKVGTMYQKVLDLICELSSKFKQRIKNYRVTNKQIIYKIVTFKTTQLAFGFVSIMFTYYYNVHSSTHHSSLTRFL